jgi:predicted Zn-dependent protease
MDMRAHGELARAGLDAARRWAGKNAAGDAYLEEIMAVTWRRAGGRPSPVQAYHDRGAAIRVWAGDEVHLASADGPPGPAVIACLRHLELPAVRGAAAMGVVDGLAGARELPRARAAGDEADFLEPLEAGLRREMSQMTWDISLEDRARVTLVADDESGLAGESYRWSRLRIHGRGEGGYAGWSGGAGKLDSLARAWPLSRLAGLLKRRWQGSRVPPGRHPRCTADTPVVFAAGNGGLLLHEFVHGLEADQQARGWSVWPPEGGVVSSLLTLWDDPTRPGLRGSFRHDDEGRPSRRRLLVRQGRMAGVLGDRRHAGKVPGAADGHGRRSSRHHPPRPRSANLYMAAGDMPTSAMSVVPRPVLWVHDMETGATDPRSGHVCLRVSDGEWFQDGRSLGPVSGLSLQGWLPDVLARVDRVAGERAADTGAASCARDGEGVPIGFMTPAYRTYGLMETA